MQFLFLPFYELDFENTCSNGVTKGEQFQQNLFCEATEKTFLELVNLRIHKALRYLREPITLLFDIIRLNLAL